MYHAFMVRKPHDEYCLRVFGVHECQFQVGPWGGIK
jgi:hypothetical protein